MLNDRRARAAATLVFIANGLTFATWAASIPAVAERLRLAPGPLAAAIVALALGSIAVMPFLGRLVDRYGARRVTFIAAAPVAPLVVAVVAAPTYPALLALGVLFGMTTGAMEVAMNAYAVAAERRAERAWMSSFHGSWSVGACGGALAVAGLLHVHVHHPERVTAALVAALLLLALRVSVAVGGVAAPVHRRAGTSRTLLLLGALAALGLLVEGALADWSGVYFRTILHAGASVAPLGYAAFAGAMMLARFAGDATVQRLRRRATLTISAGLAAVALGAGLAADAPLPVIVAFAFVGAGCANLAPTVFGLAGRLEGGHGLALVTALGYCAFLVGPAAIGGLAQATNLRIALGLVVACALALALATRFLYVPSEREYTAR